ncbi:phage protein NinX family protein [Pantoea piersonii]|jgi:hypothetical protein|uniref:phage protein NinX family protein n=1 Tax=Pantoea piersonii TaxID=2364647 RepID=UPI000EA27774|nr:phage protein NinX family protein [Pantoea piersonii]MBZ6385122.1 DUF2591 domain-containing protein [Pantoea piersonii]MBZ6385198.1 DUF2591 domain-containing protein [Pantoea piersonii]MBZ6398650.1 DUF2591 domain-containing protein [Pantoea piersonii]MBZ6398726.1 DUF2591 domain-containing protein [Pantoea piersonii]MBZ6406580.1 DUF2591 domain-containing protein [Pantoea piersonii]
MNYSELKDHEINAAVGEALGWNAKFIHQDDSVSFRDDKGRIKGTKNYCNSWSDAGPIILANKITISAPMEYDQPADWLAYPASDIDLCESHPNPLRAAMIVFLVMQEAK